VPVPGEWLQWVNEPQTAAEVESLRQSLRHGRPFGDDAWAAGTMRRLGLRAPGRRGRPRRGGNSP
jgi:hypothetical protein